MSSKLKSILKGLVFLVFFVYLIQGFRLWDETVSYTFQERDISRALGLLKGDWIFYGPEMTGGGHLPGPLYYVGMAVFFLFQEGWTAAWTMQFLLSFLAASAGFLYFKKKFSTESAFVFFILLSTAPFSFWFLRTFLNVSSLPVFVVLTLILQDLTFFSSEEKKREKAFWLCCLVIGIGLQFHLSISFLLISLLVCLLFQRRFGLPALSRQSILKGLILFLLPSVPYLVWFICRKFEIHFGVPAFYTGESDQTVGSLVHLIKIGFQEKWEIFSQKILFTIPFPLITGLMALGWGRAHFNWKRFIPLLLSAFVAFIPYLNWYISPQAIRYTILFYIVLQFVTVHVLIHVLEDKKTLQKYIILSTSFIIFMWGFVFFRYDDAPMLLNVREGLLFLTIVTGMAFFVLRENLFFKKSSLLAYALTAGLIFTQNIDTGFAGFKYKDRSGYMPSHKDWSEIWTVVYNETGWSYEEARKRIFFIGHHMSQSPKLAYQSLKLEQSGKKMLPLSPDGFFISNRYGKFKDKRKKDRFRRYKGWILQQTIPPELKEGIKNGSIALGENLSGKNLIVPYWIKSTASVPPFFHNTGEGYHYSPDEIQLNSYSVVNGVYQDKEHIVFRWNECADQHPFCSTGAFIQHRSEGSQKVIKVKVLGSSMAQISPWISPNWTQAWINSYLKVKCGSSDFSFPLAGSIGFSRLNSHGKDSPFFQGNNSFLAPFERVLTFNCNEDIRKIALGRSGSLVDKIHIVETLAAQELSVDVK